MRRILVNKSFYRNFGKLSFTNFNFNINSLMKTSKLSISTNTENKVNSSIQSFEKENTIKQKNKFNIIYQTFEQKYRKCIESPDFLLGSYVLMTLNIMAYGMITDNTLLVLISFAFPFVILSIPGIVIAYYHKKFKDMESLKNSHDD